MTPKDAEDLKRLDASIENRIRKIERLKTLEDVYEKLKPLSFDTFDAGHNRLIDWSDVEHLFEELRKE